MFRKKLRSPFTKQLTGLFCSLRSNPSYSILSYKTKGHHEGVPLFYGGERGIRTLGTVLAFTRFPVVRLRPAQPSLHFDLTIISHLFIKIKPFLKIFLKILYFFILKASLSLFYTFHFLLLHNHLIHSLQNVSNRYYAQGPQV